MTDIKVSVIIPVYNAEKHLAQCLNSVCGQTLKEIEIICVDDGSTDSTPEILEKYKQEDSRIRVYHQQNQFAGVARNTGKAHATGEYLVFWDADDFFELRALEKLYQQIKSDQADICVCGAYQYYEDTGLTDMTSTFLRMKWVPKQVPFNRETNPDYILNFTGVSTMNKMFRRAFVERYELDFQPVRNGNDVYFVALALCLAEKITVVDERLVYYRKSQTSSLVGTIQKSPLSTFHAWIDVKDYLVQREIFPERSFVNRVLGSMFVLLSRIGTSYQAFSETITFLKQEGLQRLGIVEREPAYYYRQGNEVFVSCLIHKNMEEIMAYLLHENSARLAQANTEKNRLYAVVKGKKQELKEKNKVIKKLQNEKKALQHSIDYRIGQKIMWLPRRIKQLFYKVSKH